MGLWRQSFLNKWSECPLQAYFSEVARFPEPAASKATFGSCVHAALDVYNKSGNIDSAITLFYDAWSDPSVISLPQIEVWNRFTDFAGLRRRGVEILRTYHARIRNEKRVVVASEHRFKVPFGRHELTGTVDLLDIRKNHQGKQLLLVEDHKTTSRRPTVAELALNIQVTTYIFASLQREFWVGNGDGFPEIPNGEWQWETLKDMPRRGMWNHLWDGGKELDAGGRDDNDFGRLYRLIEEIERALEYKVFVPNLGEACTFCPHSSGPCPVEVPSRESWNTERLEDSNAWV